MVRMELIVRILQAFVSLKYFIIFFLDAVCEINISIYVSFKRDFLDHVLAYFKVLFYKIRELRHRSRDVFFSC